MSHILIIDDDTNINNLLREALEKGGYACGQAYSGTEALLRLDMEPFDLVLLDLMLPGMSGEKVLEELFSYYEEWLELGIEPEFSISDEEIQVEAGPQALRRVIQNLIKNGMDHGEKRIRIALERQGDRAVMTFANQVACPERIDTEHVFDRFYKADEARSRTSTGLGLSIARELVLRMKGTITARMEGNWFVAEVQFPALTAEKTKIQRAPKRK